MEVYYTILSKLKAINVKYQAMLTQEMVTNLLL